MLEAGVLVVSVLVVLIAAVLVVLVVSVLVVLIAAVLVVLVVSVLVVLILVVLVILIAHDEAPFLRTHSISRQYSVYGNHNLPERSTAVIFVLTMVV